MWYLQCLDQDGHVGLRDAQGEAKHGRDHDETDDQVQPDPHSPEGEGPEVLHFYLSLCTVCSMCVRICVCV